MKHLSSNPHISIKVDAIILVGSLSDDELSTLHSAVYQEMQRRIHHNARRGYYPGLNEEECNAARFKHKNDAIIKYYQRCRTNNNERVDMMVARGVVEVYLDLHSG